MRRTHPPRDPLEPVTTTVGLLTGLTGLVLLLSLLVHQALWGNGPVCTSVPADGMATRSSGLTIGGQVRGSQATIGNVILCVNHPDTWQRFAGPIIQTVANLMIFLSQVHYPGLNWFEPDKLHLSVSALLGGLALITVARVMRVGVTMREELDVTI